MGEWLKINGESIYSTRAGVIQPRADVVSTRKGDTHYVHLLENLSDWVRLPGVPDTVTSAHLLSDDSAVEMKRAGDQVILSVPEDRRDALDTVVVLQ
jgi:alpha-L-fucosidase